MEELEVCRPCEPTKDGVVVGSTPGVHILDARRPGCGCGWALAVEPFDREDFGLDDDDPVPDLSLDPEDMVLTVINATQGARAYHVSIADRDVLGQLGAEGDLRVGRQPLQPNGLTLDFSLSGHREPRPGAASDAPRRPACKSNLELDFNVSVFEYFDTNTSALLRELDESNRFVQKSPKSTSM